MVVKCLSCSKEVDVELVPYGNGHIASCPLCKQLAYSASKKTINGIFTKKEDIIIIKMLGQP
jgi:hypothetical protein